MTEPSRHAETELARRGTFGSMLRDILRRPVVVSLLLFAVTLAVFGPAAGFDFINCDDPDYFSANPHIKNGLTWANLVWAFQHGYVANWHPLTWISLMLDATIFGPDPWGPHLTNVILHAVNAALLFVLLRRATGFPGRSAIVAAFFALHPLHVESVAWVAERKDVLSTLFALLALIAYIHYARPTKPRNLKSRMGYLLSLLFFAAGLMCKSMLVTLPFLMLLLDYWPLRRIKLSTLQRQPVRLLPPLLFDKLPFLLLSAVSCLITFLVQRSGSAVLDLVHLPLTVRIENGLVSYARYLGKLGWPMDLAVMYPYPESWPWAFVVFAGFLIGYVSWGTSSLGLRRPYALVGWLWFLGTLVPVIGLVQVGMQSMADRYTYLPAIGVFLIVVWGTADVLRHWRLPRWAVGLLTIAVLIAATVRTAGQLRYWRNSETLFRHALAVTDGNVFAHNNLGCYFRVHGRYDEAAKQFDAALKLTPNHADVLNNYGYLYAEQKQFEPAIDCYRKALRARPGHVSAQENLAEALAKTGKFDEALDLYLALLKQSPDKAELPNRIGIVLASLGRVDEAKKYFQNAVHLNPDYAAAHCNLGNALAARRDFDGAIQQYREALRINPDYPEAQNNLGGALEDKGALPEALPCYQAAVRLKPDYAQAHYNLGNLLAQFGRRGEALAHLTEAIRLKPDYAKAREALRKLNAPKSD